MRFRHFDPNQGNYILSGSASLRTMRVEAGRRLLPSVPSPRRSRQQRSRRLEHDGRPGAARVHDRSGARGCVASMCEASCRSPSWTTRGRSTGTCAPTCRFAPASGCWPPAICASSAWTARRIGAIKRDFVVEGGVRVEGGAGAMEFFLAVERRVDPYPLQFGTANWVTVGFRLLSR